MSNKITVKFEAQGASSLKSAIDQLHLAQTKLEKGTKAYERALARLNKEQSTNTKLAPLGVRNNRLLENSFATIRSKLLLASFAFSLVNASVLKLGRAYGEQEQAEKRLEGLVGSSVDSLKAKASALQATTRFGDEQTLGAMSLVSAYTSEQAAISQLTEAAMDLATVKGMDLNTATDMLAKSVFSSTNSMSRYGIEIEGAAGSGARLNSALNAISTQMGGASERDTLTLLGAMDQMNNAVGDLAERMGEILAPVIISVANATKEFANNIDAEEIKSYATAIGIAGTAYLSYTTAISLATHGTNLFTKATKKNLVILGATFVIAELIDMTDMFASSTEDVAKELDNLNKKLKENDDFNKDKIKSDQKTFDNTTKRALLEAKLEQQFQLNVGAQMKYTDAKMKDMELNHRHAIVQQELERLKEREVLMTFEQINGIEHQTKMQELLIENYKIETEMILNKNKAEEKSKKLAKDNTDNIIKGLGAVAKMGAKSAKEMANVQYGLAIIDSIRSGMATRKNLSDEGFLPPIPAIAGALETAAMIAIATQIRAQQFETGGLVGGRRHSQGGTIIEAERGEFVMSRNAVESIGVDNLEAMNQGGAGASIVINNPIISSEFVETELPELIAEAVRKGADFGMS